MPIFIGTSQIINTKLIIGASNIDKVYIGDKFIFPYEEVQLPQGNAAGLYTLSLMTL